MDAVRLEARADVVETHAKKLQALLKYVRTRGQEVGGAGGGSLSKFHGKHHNGAEISLLRRGRRGRFTVCFCLQGNTSNTMDLNHHYFLPLPAGQDQQRHLTQG